MAESDIEMSLQESCHRELSPREEEIVELSILGFTNDAIADKLKLSVGTVNTYWLRIRLKVGGAGRTDSVAKVITGRADRALQLANSEREALISHISNKSTEVVELKASLALLQLAMDQIQSTVWATDRDLRLHIVANGEFPATHFGVVWEIGATVYEIFKTKNPADLAIKAHLDALDGTETNIHLTGIFNRMMLRTMPLKDEFEEIIGCVSIVNMVS